MPSTGYMIRHLPVIAFSKSSFHKPTDPVNFFSVFQFSFCVCVCVCVWGGGVALLYKDFDQKSAPFIFLSFIHLFNYVIAHYVNYVTF